MKIEDAIRVLTGSTEDPRTLEFRRILRNPGPDALFELMALRVALEVSKFAAGEIGQVTIAA